MARDVFEHDVVRRSPLCEVAAWLHLVSLANYADNAQHSPPLLRGQVCTSAGKLARAWGWERSRVKSEVARWERAGMLTKEGVGHATIYTITGFDSWQSEGRKTRTSDEPVTNQSRTTHEPDGSRCDAGLRGGVNHPRTSHEPEVNQPRTATTRHVDNRHEDKENRSVATLPISSGEPDTSLGVEPSGQGEPDLTTVAGRKRAWPALSALPRKNGRRQYPAEFTAFRAAYPFPTERATPGDTYPAWRTHAVEGAGNAEAMLAGARAYRSKIDRDGTEARYTKMAATWIRAEGWIGMAGGDVTPEPVTEGVRPFDGGGLFIATDDEAWERRKAEHAEREAQRAARRVAADADCFDC